MIDLVARYWRMDDLVGGGEPPGLAACELEEVAVIHHREPDVEFGGYATGTPSHRAQMDLQTEAQRKGRSCEAQGPSGGEGRYVQKQGVDFE